MLRSQVVVACGYTAASLGFLATCIWQPWQHLLVDLGLLTVAVAAVLTYAGLWLFTHRLRQVVHLDPEACEWMRTHRAEIERQVAVQRPEFAHAEFTQSSELTRQQPAYLLLRLFAVAMGTPYLMAAGLLVVRIWRSSQG